LGGIGSIFPASYFIPHFFNFCLTRIKVYQIIDLHSVFKKFHSDQSRIFLPLNSKQDQLFYIHPIFSLSENTYLKIRKFPIIYDIVSLMRMIVDNFWSD